MTLLDDLALLYLKTAYPNRQNPKETTRQSVIPLAKKFNLDHVHDELRREKANKQLKVTLGKGMAVPYFQSEWGMAYTQQQQQNSDRRVEMPSISATKGPAAMCMFTMYCNCSFFFNICLHFFSTIESS